MMKSNRSPNVFFTYDDERQFGESSTRFKEVFKILTHNKVVMQMADVDDKADVF